MYSALCPLVAEHRTQTVQTAFPPCGFGDALNCFITSRMYQLGAGQVRSLEGLSVKQAIKCVQRKCGSLQPRAVLEQAAMTGH